MNGQIDITIIIPVKNGMPKFKSVLESVSQQNFDGIYEVIIIDSGSTDGSLEFAKKMDERFQVITIPPSSFGHGRTRNLGVKMAKGKFCAFLTHDALPKDETWLSELVSPMLNDSEIAGVFGRHIAYPNASPFTTWEVNRHFDGFKDYETVMITDKQQYEHDESIQKVYHFFSDNNSCMRRSVWEKFPYPDVDFAEDQLWAKQIIEAGYKKAFASNSVVYHSHDYSVWERFQRSYDESRAFRELFGYQICPSLKRMLANWVFLNKRDLLNGLSNGWLWKFPADFLTRPLINLAATLGTYFGTTNPSFISRHENIISRDKKIKTSNR